MSAYFLSVPSVNLHHKFAVKLVINRNIIALPQRMSQKIPGYHRLVIALQRNFNVLAMTDFMSQSIEEIKVGQHICFPTACGKKIIAEHKPKELDPAVRKQIEEIVRKRRGEAVFPTSQEGENTATVSLVLGILSIVMGCSGYTVGIGLAGLLGSVVSKRIKPRENGVATAAMAVSIVGIVFSLLGLVFMTVMMPRMGDMQTYMITTDL